MKYTKGELIILDTTKNGDYIGFEKEMQTAIAQIYDKKLTPIFLAAPEMYDALSKIMIWVNSHPQTATIVHHVINEANAALAKVEVMTTWTSGRG